MKHDLVLDYTAPQITGVTDLQTGLVNRLPHTEVPGATDYDLRVIQVVDANWLEGAENGTDAVIINQNGVAYDVLQSQIVANGSHAFRFAHIGGQGIAPPDQSLELDRDLYVHEDGELQFLSRLGVATTSQYALVEVSTDDGTTWQEVYSQAGTSVLSNQPTEVSFHARSVSLAAYEGQIIRVRFRYALPFGGSYFSGTSTGFGWYIDDVEGSDLEEVTSSTTSIGTSGTFDFTPPADGEYLLVVRPLNQGNPFPFGNSQTVQASAPTARDTWRRAHFDLAEIGDPTKEPTVWGDTADPENDGLENLGEYGLDGNPTVADAYSLSPVLATAGNQMSITFTKVRTDIIYRVETSTSPDGGDFSTAGVSQVPNPDTAAAGTPITATVPFSEEARYLRLRMEQAGE